MDNVYLIVMGKTGAGKSTLINAVLEEDMAPTGRGRPITKENQVYTKQIMVPLDTPFSDNGKYRMLSKTLYLYDTVGLEIDASVTKKTLRKVKRFIQKTQSHEKEKDLTLIWFCVNCRSSRFEPYEIELVRMLSMEHEIPFILVLTQCIAGERGELETQIKKNFPDIPIVPILAKDYKLRSGAIPAFGVTELLQCSLLDYKKSKLLILEDKLAELSKDREKRIAQIREDGANCIASYANTAMKIGIIPVAAIPIIHSMCIKLLVDLNKLVGINSAKGFASDIFINAVVGAMATPLMALPILSALVASAYIESVGELYLGALMCVIERSEDDELTNNDLMAKRISTEIKKQRK